MNESLINSDGYLRSVIDTIPSIVFITDADAKILDANKAASEALDGNDRPIVRRLCGDVLRCINAGESGEYCGKTNTCDYCIIRGSIAEALEGQRVHRRRAMIEIGTEGNTENVHLFVSAAPFNFFNSDHIASELSLIILEDITELMELKKIVPICSNCKRIRKDDNYWEQVESFMQRCHKFHFTHSICPDCREKLYPDLRPYK
ncbi:MAG: PAS domain-containing protein [Deltaproteobacteria bacterium]|nr:PAS domain-containing protein [Deltaproteobacteria bacterium]